MRAIVFNSLLILIPVIGSQILAAAYSGPAYLEQPSVDAVDRTRRNVDAAFAAMAPKGADQKYAFWHDSVARELTARDAAGARGFLIAAPDLLDRERSRELLAAAQAERLGSADARLEAAALRKLPVEIGIQYEQLRLSERVPSTDTAPPKVPAVDTGVPAEPPGAATPALPPDPAIPADPPAAATETVGLISAARPESDARFAVLGTFADLANRSQAWIDGDQTDVMELKMTGIGLLASQDDTDASRARIRAASLAPDDA
jgi:hypothetical protein